ncbi:MAG: hypothetical protein [Caudoviricetes sp.]|nr:MAG: hypothetical protein [Caudoviricetes sp.]
MSESIQMQLDEVETLIEGIQFNTIDMEYSYIVYKTMLEDAMYEVFEGIDEARAYASTLDNPTIQKASDVLEQLYYEKEQLESEL